MKIKEDKKWLIGILERQTTRYKKINGKKHNHITRIKLLQKTINFLEDEN